jgi:hypothetical protein
LSQKLSELCSQEINSDAEFESDEVTYDAAADNTALKRKKEKIEASPEPQKSYEEKALEEYELFRKNRRKVDENYVVYCYHDEHNNVYIGRSENKSLNIFYFSYRFFQQKKVFSYLDSVESY